MRRIVMLFTAIAIVNIGVSLRPAPAQSPVQLQAGAIDIERTGVHPNPDDPGDLIVSVRITIRAGDQPLVIPNCADNPAQRNSFCSAQLTRSTGKGIGVRRGLAASLGEEPEDHWKPVTLAPGTQSSFAFFYSTRLLDVHPGEHLRVGFQIWPNVESMKDWKSATTVLTPIFKNPSKAD